MRFGLVGSGRMGLTYAECLTRYTTGAQLVALTGGTRAPGLASRYGVVYEPTLDDLLGRGDIDVVLVATPHSRHRDQVVQAAAAGKHVLVEKPMALSTAECDAMIDACRAAEVSIGVIQTARYTAPAQAAHQLIADGRIGEVKMLQVNWLEAGYSPATPEGENSWVSDPAEGGAFLDAGVHAFDVLRWLTNSEPRLLFGRALTYLAEPLVYQSGMAQVLFASGAMANVWISFEMPTPGFPESTMRTRIVGSKGVVDVDSYGQVQLGDAAGRAIVVERAPYDMMDITHPARLEQFIAQMRDYVDARRHERMPPVGGADGRAAVAMVEACYRSTASGQAVSLGERAEMGNA
jgi:UDP-N-acetyl-2-amino-2-deoxyglucuronate dehydrogenase